MDNANFEGDQKTFFKKVERGIKHVEQILDMEKFVKFSVDIWKKDDRTPEIPLIEGVSKRSRDKITCVKKFNITVESLEKETKKRKHWTAPGTDSIQNFWWKKLKPARRELKRAFEHAKDNNGLNTSMAVFRKNYSALKNKRPN